MNELAVEDKNPYKGAGVKVEGEKKSLAKPFFTLLFLGLLGIVAYTIFLVLTQGNLRPIKNIDISNPLIYASERDVYDAIQEVGRLDYFFINLNEIARKVENIPWVKAVSVEKKWPDTLIIKIEERIPYVRFGQNEFLDREGNRFSLPPSEGLEDLFQVYGDQGTEKKVLGMYAILTPWFKERNMQLNAIRLDKRQSWHLYTINNIEIILGKDELNLRLKKLFSIYHNLISEYKRVIEVIDLRYQGGGFSARWKGGVTAKFISDVERKNPNVKIKDKNRR